MISTSRMYWKVENEVLRVSANRGNICRKMADVSSLIHNFYNIEIGLVSEIHQSSIKIHTVHIHTKHTKHTQQHRGERKTANSHKYQIENIRMNIAYNVRFFFLYVSFFASILFSFGVIIIIIVVVIVFLTI